MKRKIPFLIEVLEKEKSFKLDFSRTIVKTRVNSIKFKHNIFSKNHIHYGNWRGNLHLRRKICQLFSKYRNEKLLENQIIIHMEPHKL